MESSSEFTNTWVAGKPYYNPEDIKVPTLLIHAEWDADLPSYMARAYFAKLANAPYKRFVEIGEGTHSVMLEKNRMQFFREILNFLTEPAPAASDYGPTGISLPTNTGAPDGLPVGEPPGGSSVTAYVAPSTTPRS